MLPLLVIGTLLFSAWTFYPTLKLQYAQSRENAMLSAELQGIKERNADLRKQVERLKTPEGVEDAARESLGLVRPDENLYVVTGVEETKTADPIQRAEKSREDWWVPVLDALFGFDDGSER